jgi:hypothetical protein
VAARAGAASTVSSETIATQGLRAPPTVLLHTAGPPYP